MFYMLFYVYTEHFLFLELMRPAVFCLTQGPKGAGFPLSCYISARRITAQHCLGQTLRCLSDAKVA